MDVAAASGIAGAALAKALAEVGLGGVARRGSKARGAGLIAGVTGRRG